LEKRIFSVFFFSIYVSFFEVSHEQLSLKEGALIEANHTLSLAKREEVRNMQ